MFSMTALQLAAEIRQRRLGVEEVARTFLARIEKYGGKGGLNAVAELNEAVLDQARAMDNLKSGREGALFGLPVLIKDNIDVAGLHTTAGSLALADNLAWKDAPIVANLRRSGALILGKTNMTEFANYTGARMPNGYSARGGQVINAYDPQKDPSGSSTGSAVAMSAGLCAAAIGTDTSFSIVGCATDNGVTGLKPPHGALSSQGILPIARTLDSAGPITRDLRDALLVCSCMRDRPLNPIEPAPPEKIRLAVNLYNQEQVSKAQLERYDRLLSALRADGAQIETVQHPYCPHQKDIMRYEFRHDLEAYLSESRARRRTLEEIVRYYEEHPATMPYGIEYLRGALDGPSGKLDDEIYLRALAERQKLGAQLAEDLKKYDACLMTGPTNVMHFLGFPSLALRLCMAQDGTPQGMILYGADEEKLYAAALTMEKYASPIPLPPL